MQFYGVFDFVKMMRILTKKRLYSYLQVISRADYWTRVEGEQQITFEMVPSHIGDFSYGDLCPACRTKIDKDRRKTFDGIMIYLWWNMLKERNRRIFQNKSLQPRQVALLCKEEIEQYQLTTGNNGWTHHS